MRGQDATGNTLSVQGTWEWTLQATWRQIDGPPDDRWEAESSGESAYYNPFRTGASWGLVNTTRRRVMSFADLYAQAHGRDMGFAELCAQARHEVWPATHNSDPERE